MATANITEKHAKDKVKKIIELYSKYNDIYSLCPVTFGYGESGHPDRLILVGGNVIGIEVKKDGNNYHCRPELKPKSNEVMQKRQAQKLTDAGGAWVCIHNNNLQDLVDLLDSKCEKSCLDFSDDDFKTLTKLKG